MLNKILKQLGLPEPTLEYKFHQNRRWRIDFAYPEIKFAIEIEGGIFVYGRHTRGAGFLKDIEKYNALTEQGWALLRYTPSKIDYDQIKRVYLLREYDFKLLKNMGDI